jgi:hypothetical protein
MAKTNSTVTSIDDEVTTPVVADSAPVEAVAAPTGLPAGFSGRRKNIILHASDGELGKLPQVFGINGFVIEIQRNVKVAVPEEFVTAIQEMSSDVVDSKGNLVGTQPRFNISEYGFAE